MNRLREQKQHHNMEHDGKFIDCDMCLDAIREDMLTAKEIKNWRLSPNLTCHVQECEKSPYPWEGGNGLHCKKHIKLG